MSSKSFFWLLVRLAVLLAAVVAQSSKGPRPTYADFERQHIDSSRLPVIIVRAYCKSMMVRRGMAKPFCKDTNIFIRSRTKHVLNICRGQGTLVNENLYTSRRKFNVIICRNMGTPQKCSYRGRRARRRVQVVCVNNMPVQFQSS